MSQARISQPNGFNSRTSCLPMWPQPWMPTVRPDNSWPMIQRGRSPRRIARFSAGTCLRPMIIIDRVSSATARAFTPKV